MRLVKPSRGECADRLTILELKVMFGKARDIPVIHFEEEYEAIQKYLGHDVWTKMSESAAYGQLQYVNRALWDLEGGVRHNKDWMEDPWLAVHHLKDITHLNDKRAELVAELDGHATEKLY